MKLNQNMLGISFCENEKINSQTVKSDIDTV